MKRVFVWAAVAAVVLWLSIALLGMYSTWRECETVGGVTVRGLFGLVCIQEKK